MSNADLREEALAAATTFLSAFDRLAWAEFSAFIAPDISVFMPFPDVQRRLDGKEAVEAIFSAFFERMRRERKGPSYLAINPLDLDLVLLGKAALVTFHLDNGKTLSRRSAIFQKTFNHWQLIHLHASNLPVASSH